MCVRERVPVRDGQSSVYGSLQGSEHFVSSGGSGKAGIQVAGEGTGLSISALHIKLLSGDLHLALIHLIQAKFVQQLRGGEKEKKKKKKDPGRVVIFSHQ